MSDNWKAGDRVQAAGWEAEVLAVLPHEMPPSYKVKILAEDWKGGNREMILDARLVRKLTAKTP